MAVLLLAPAGAAAETAETTEPAPTAESPPPSTGWVPQGGASEGSSGGSAGAQEGSSLGSGGSSHPAPEPAPTESPTPSAPPPEPEPSTGSGETETSVQPAAEEPAIEPAPDPEPAKPDPAPPAHVSLGKADAVLASSGVEGISASSASTPGAGATAAVAQDSGLPWIALIVCGMVLLFAGARLIFGPIETDFLRYSRFRLIRRAGPRG